MEYALAGEVLDCLSAERRVFPYFKHRYALILLGLVAGRGRSVSELRNTAFAGLLTKPILGSVARQREICAADLEGIWPGAFESYVLTLGLWGDPRRGYRRWNQITRRGVNLVLQVNFSAAHDRAYRRLLRTEEDGYHPFEWASHPVNALGRRTLAWVRLDLDLDEGEALIEEVQSDWIREATWVYEELRRVRHHERSLREHWFFRGTTRSFKDVERYVHRVLPVHKKVWEEAALAAAVDFLAREVGIREIYLHTWEGGRRLKGMPGERPPVSVYETLPRRFCFTKLPSGPRFLQKEPGHRFRRRLARVAEQHGFWFLRL